MAEDAGATAAQGAGKGLGALMRKVGPLPLIVWIAAGIAIYLYVEHRRGAGRSATGAQTDPAGNTGTINPATGYVYGTSQDSAALAAQNSGGATGTTSGSGGSTIAGQYATNDAWAAAAINFLVGRSIDPVAANSAIEQYLNGQPLTPDQQGDVNLAIQSIGAPPQPPQPGNAPPPIVTPPSPGPTYAANPPTGLAVASKTSSTIAVKWNRAANAAGYSVTYSSGSQPSSTLTVTGTDTTATISGLQPATAYTIQVQATPAKPGDAFASTTATTSGTAAPAPSPSGPTVLPQNPGAGSGTTHTYTVVHGDTLSGIAARNHISLAQLRTMNPVYWTNPKYRQGNEIFAGDTVVLPGAAR